MKICEKKHDFESPRITEARRKSKEGKSKPKAKTSPKKSPATAGQAGEKPRSRKEIWRRGKRKGDENLLKKKENFKVKAKPKLL